MTRIVVIGGVAAGMSAASQAKRRKPEAEVIALERGPYVSYGACGMPYNIEDPARDIEDLVVITPEQFRKMRGIDARVRHAATAIDTQAKRVTVRDSAREYTLDYDKLVVATGATAVRPPFPGLDLPGVFLLRELTDGDAVKRHIADGRPKRAAIIGAGYIGMEMAEALAERGLQVTVLEKAPQALPGFEPAIAGLVAEELARQSVELRTGVSVQGIALGETGAIAVDDHQRTNVADVYAAGDCAEAWHRVLKRPVYIPLGTTANKQGKVAGANAAGADEAFGGIVGSAGFKVFDLEVGRTGLGGAEIERYGLDAISAVSRHASRGHHYPGGVRLTTVLFAERGSGRLLGAQMAGADVVAKRIDVLAAALQAGMTLADVEALDLTYAPPFAPVYDPLLIAAGVARKALAKA
jgi:NADPH-dependent 2,4-dienoyl-CoA reductase/sulfur reductase-like enzyme